MMVGHDGSGAAVAADLLGGGGCWLVGYVEGGGDLVLVMMGHGGGISRGINFFSYASTIKKVIIKCRYNYLYNFFFNRIELHMSINKKNIYYIPFIFCKPTPIF